MRRYDLDPVLAPADAPAWRTSLENGDLVLVGPSRTPAIPDITVPAGYSSGLPVGVSSIGTRVES